MNKKMPKKNGFVTKEYLDETLDKRLTDQTQVILVAVGEIMDTKLTKLKEELRTDISNVKTLIDGYVKAQEDFKQEFVIIKEEVQKIKDFIKKKFKVEIKAI